MQLQRVPIVQLQRVLISHPYLKPCAKQYARNPLLAVLQTPCLTALKHGALRAAHPAPQMPGKAHSQLLTSQSRRQKPPGCSTCSALQARGSG